MKKYLIFILFISTSLIAKAQSECHGREPLSPLFITKEMEDAAIKNTNAINTPYCVRVYITVFADAGGTNRAATDADILRQFQNMVNQYNAHSICFLLVNIKQVNNTDLNSHNADTEEADLNPYIQANCLNIFLHNYLDSNSGTLNGSAYGIPNTYMSEASWAIASTTNISTMGHEVGHCLGLYHTFSTGNGAENVTRNSGNGCYNCTSTGDLLCDTPADDPTTPNDNVNSSCVYTAGRQDACNVTYIPMTSNIMAYGNRACRTTFTSGQGNRMRVFLLGTPSLLALVANDIVNRPSSANSSITWTINEGHETARDLLTISNFSNSSYTVSGSAVRHFVSKRVVLKPGTTFSPASGRVHVKVSDYCN
jgi:hypothetical protein